MLKKVVALLAGLLLTIVVTHQNPRKPEEVRVEAATSAVINPFAARPSTTSTTTSTTTTTTTEPATTTTTVRRQSRSTTTTPHQTQPGSGSSGTAAQCGGDLYCLITLLGGCESGNNPTENTGNGFEGEFQFVNSTWRSYNSDYAHAYEATESAQRSAVRALFHDSGDSFRSQFPGCSRKLGLP